MIDLCCFILIFASLTFSYCYSFTLKSALILKKNEKMTSLTSFERLKNSKSYLSMSMITNDIEIREFVKIFDRIADKTLLLNISSAGTPEIANCCHR